MSCHMSSFTSFFLKITRLSILKISLENRKTPPYKMNFIFAQIAPILACSLIFVYAAHLMKIYRLSILSSSSGISYVGTNLSWHKLRSV